jgi:hypothetical protein
MSDRRDTSDRAISLARMFDRLRPGKYTIHLTWPHPRSDERPSAEVVPRNLTPKPDRATKDGD